MYSSETAELSLRDYGGQLCLLTHCSIPSGLTGKQRPAVPLVVTCLKSRGPVAPPVGATQRAFSSSGAGGPRSHIRQGAYQCVSKSWCCRMPRRVDRRPSSEVARLRLSCPLAGLPQGRCCLGPSATDVLRSSRSYAPANAELVRSVSSHAIVAFVSGAVPFA